MAQEAKVDPLVVLIRKDVERGRTQLCALLGREVVPPQPAVENFFEACGVLVKTQSLVLVDLIGVVAVRRITCTSSLQFSVSLALRVSRVRGCNRPQLRRLNADHVSPLERSRSRNQN